MTFKKTKMKNTILLILLLISWQQTNAQCYSDRHSTSWFDAWISCETSPNPNSDYGNSHWLLYDLGYDYTLFDSKFWNSNEPNNLNNGIQNYTIDYSLDAINWTNLGSFSLNQGSGIAIYEGEEGPDFLGSLARYVLITPTSNFGGDCYSLSEVKFYVDENYSGVIDEKLGFNVVAFPNPFKDQLSISINTLTPEEAIKYTLYDILGRNIYQNVKANMLSNKPIEINKTSILDSGIYFLKIEHNNLQTTLKLIKE